MAGPYYVDPTKTGGADTGVDAANAWTTLQRAINGTDGTQPVAGDTVYLVANGSTADETITAAVSMTGLSGTYNGGYIKFIGCNSGGTVDGSYYIIDGNNANIDGIYFNGASYIWLENIKITQCDGTGAINSASAISDYCVFSNVWMHDNDAYGIGTNNTSYLPSLTTYRCKFTSNADGGYYRPNAKANINACVFTGNALGVHGLKDLNICNSVFYNNSTYGVTHYSSSLSTRISNCVFDSNGTAGFHLSYAGSIWITGCRFTNHSGAGDYGVKIDVNTRVLLSHCYFGSNDTAITADRYDILSINGDTSHVVLNGSDTDHGYTTPGSDFNLVASATGYSEAMILP